MSSGSRKKRQSVAQTAGGIMFGFEQQVFRDVPPPEEVVHQARPDASVPAGDGSFVTLQLPDDVLPEDPPTDDPWAGIEDELADQDDPWAEFAAETATASDADGAPAEDPKPEGR